MKKIFLLFFLLAALVSASEPSGTYTNGADGFDLKTFYVLKDGRGFIGAPVKWRYDSEKQIIVIRGNLGTNLAVEERVLRYDAEKNIISLPDSLALTQARLQFAGKDIHPGILKYLEAFDWNFESHVIGKK